MRDVVGEASYEYDIPKSTMCHDKVPGARFEGCLVVSVYSTAPTCDVSARKDGAASSALTHAEGFEQLARAE